MGPTAGVDLAVVLCRVERADSGDGELGGDGGPVGVFVDEVVVQLEDDALPLLEDGFLVLGLLGLALGRSSRRLQVDRQERRRERQADRNVAPTHVSTPWTVRRIDSAYRCRN